MEIIKGTEDFFIQDSKYVISYLKSRKVREPTFFALLKNNTFGFIRDVTFKVDNIQYNVAYLLSCSENSGYDIVKANGNLSMVLQANEVAIGIVEGDDVIYYDNLTGGVYLFLIENGNGERLKIANTLSEFTKIFN